MARGNVDSISDGLEEFNALTDEIESLRNTWLDLILSADECLGDFIDSKFGDSSSLERFKQISEEASKIKEKLDSLIEDQRNIALILGINR